METTDTNIESRKENFDMWQFLERRSDLSLFGVEVVYGHTQVWCMPKPNRQLSP